MKVVLVETCSFIRSWLDEWMRLKLGIWADDLIQPFYAISSKWPLQHNMNSSNIYYFRNWTRFTVKDGYAFHII